MEVVPAQWQAGPRAAAVGAVTAGVHGACWPLERAAAVRGAVPVVERAAAELRAACA